MQNYLCPTDQQCDHRAKMKDALDVCPGCAGNPLVTAEVVARAKELCLAQCRAAFCVDGKRCGTSWPGDGGPGFKIHVREALKEKHREPVTA